MTPTFDTRAEAVEWKSAADDAKKRGLPIPPPVKSRSRSRGRYQTVKEVTDAWLEHWEHNLRPGQGRSGIEATKRLLRIHVLPDLGRRTISSVADSDVESLRDKLASKGLSVTYQGSILLAIRRTFKFAKEHDWVLGDPSYGVHPKAPAGTQRRPLTIDNCFQRGSSVSWELAMALSLLIRPRFRVGFWIQIIVGLRVGELFGLTLADWYPSQMILLVHEQAGSTYVTDEPGAPAGRVDRTKTQAGTRALIVPQILAEAIDRHIATWHAGDPLDTPLITNPRGGKRYDTYEDEVAKALHRYKILNERGKPATNHYFRHLATSNFIKAGINGRVASQLLGHERSVPGAAPMTGFYDLGASAEEVQVEIDKLAQQMERAGLVDLDAPPADAAVYMTRLEAAIAINRSEDTIRHWQREGRLSAALLPMSAGGRPVALVPRADVESLIERGAARWFLEDAKDFLGMDRHAILRAARVADVPVQRGVRGARCWFTADDFDRLASEIEAWKSFRAQHLTLEEAGTKLHKSIEQMRRLTNTQKVLAIVERPAIVLGVPGNTAWVRACDVDRIASRVQPVSRGGHPEGNTELLLSVAQVAQQLRRSSATIRELVKAGHLERVVIEPNTNRYWIRPESVLEYASGSTKR